jgi:hypothetical protein
MLSPRDKYSKKNLVIKNVSSSTSHKKLCLYVIRNSVIMSLREFKKIYFSWNEVWPQRSIKVTKGHKRPLLWQNHSGTFVYRPILLQICMITVFTLNYDLKCHFYVFTLRPSDLITTLTYVLMNNVCRGMLLWYCCIVGNKETHSFNS